MLKGLCGKSLGEWFLLVIVPLGLGPRPGAQQGLQDLLFHRAGGGLCTPDGDKIPQPPVDSPMHHSLGSGPPCLTPEHVWEFSGCWDSPDLQGAGVRPEHFPGVPGPCWLPLDPAW